MTKSHKLTIELIGSIETIDKMTDLLHIPQLINVLTGVSGMQTVNINRTVLEESTALTPAVASKPAAVRRRSRTREEFDDDARSDEPPTVDVKYQPRDSVAVKIHGKWRQGRVIAVHRTSRAVRVRLNYNNEDVTIDAIDTAKLVQPLEDDTEDNEVSADEEEDYEKGDAVEVKVGRKWLPGKVIKVLQDGAWKVQLDEIDATYTVENDNLRRPAASSASETGNPPEQLDRDEPQFERGDLPPALLECYDLVVAVLTDLPNERLGFARLLTAIQAKGYVRSDATMGLLLRRVGNMPGSRIGVGQDEETGRNVYYLLPIPVIASR